MSVVAKGEKFSAIKNSVPDASRWDGTFNGGPILGYLLNTKADICILQGGTDSGKTYNTMLYLFKIATTTKPPDVDPIITIVNKSVPDSKKGAYRIAQSIYNSNPFVNVTVKDWNQGERVITFTTGWIMEFLGATDEQSAKQGKRQYLFCNEANGITYPIFWQYAKRTRIRVIIDYNPSALFWSHEKLIGTTPDGNDLFATVELRISDHRHNPFLDAKDHAKTENIKDKNLHDVYARGKTGNLIGIIYPDWKMIPDVDFPWLEDKMFGGIDFGYTNDPTAAVLVARIANSIYVHELCYQPAMTAIQIQALYATALANNKTQTYRNLNLYCEHDGDMTRQIKMLGMRRAIPARKGPNSVNPGISKVKEYNVFYTASSANIDMERKKYMWEIDEDTGKPTNVPVEGNDHLMDAIRYAVYTHFYRKS